MREVREMRDERGEWVLLPAICSTAKGRTGTKCLILLEESTRIFIDASESIMKQLFSLE